MKCDEQMSMLMKVQEMQFVALELNLYLDTHVCDEDALNDFKKARIAQVTGFQWVNNTDRLCSPNCQPSGPDIGLVAQLASRLHHTLTCAFTDLRKAVQCAANGCG